MLFRRDMHDPQHSGIALGMVENVVRQMALKLKAVAGHQARGIAIDLQRQLALDTSPAFSPWPINISSERTPGGMSMSINCIS